MTLHLDDKWVWDFWLIRDGSNFHIFYLQAPRALGNPQLRHQHSSIGHAVSVDLENWDILPDAILPSNKDTWDNKTSWTGCTIRQHDTWFMFYTGTSHQDNGLIQRIGVATSNDLINWTKFEGNPIMDIDSRWYELYTQGNWYEQTWRDPWVFQYEGKYHALLTARSNHGEPDARGVIGHACSSDLVHWDITEPLTALGNFAYMEVPQLVNIKQKWYLVFCVEKDKYSEQQLSKQAKPGVTGTHYLIADHPLGPFTQPSDSVLLGDALGSYYSGKLVQGATGEWKFMTAIQKEGLRGYIGNISNPLPIFIRQNGEIQVKVNG